MGMLSSVLAATGKGDNRMRKPQKAAPSNQKGKSAQAQVAEEGSVRLYTTAHELAWIRELYKAGKFNALLGLRQAYKNRDWTDANMRVDSHKIMDALEAICTNIEKITGLSHVANSTLQNQLGVVNRPSVLQSELAAMIERTRRKGQVQ